MASVVVKYITMQKTQSHLHDKSYWGEMSAAPVVQWLNSKKRSTRDPVERLINLNSQQLEGGLSGVQAREEIHSFFSALVRQSKLAVAPVLSDVSTSRWNVAWRMVGKMDPLQGLALVKLLHLADGGLLDRVRKCASEDCGSWFYQRFSHQQFHSKKCQERTFRAKPGWKERHAEQMRQLRHTKKFQMQNWLKTQQKRKGGKK